ncbi:MAG: hypothetical protein IJ274_14830 [Lachnospiraceae bacterium]|nr:hypothetical protein [Lachnospiraceae bacterium]
MRKKTKRISILCLTVALALGMTACGKEAKIEKQLTLGQASMDAGDYVAAITAYEEVISLDKYEIAGYEGLVNAMVKDNRDGEEIKAVVQEVTVVLEELKATETGIPEEKKAEAENFYVQASTAFSGNADEELEILKSGVGVLGEDSQLADTYETKAEDLVEHYLEGNNLEEAKQQAEQLAQTIPSNPENETLVEEVTEKADAEQGLVDIILKAHGYIEAKSWRSLAYFSESEELAIIKEKVGDVGNYTYIFGGGTTGLGIGYYSMEGCSCDQWYVGNYVDGIRSGNGGWYWAKKDGSDLQVEIYEGNWENDMPNGNGHLYIKYGDKVLGDEDVIVKNGLLNGTFTRVSGQYTGTYEAIDGIYVEKKAPDWIKDELPEGYYVYWIGNDASGEGEIVSYVSYGSKHGIAHFRN